LWVAAFDAILKRYGIGITLWTRTYGGNE
jgi:hypothetical protein